MAKGIMWYWRGENGQILELFARDGLTDEYCEPQMKFYCEELGLYKPFCFNKSPVELPDVYESY